MISELCRFLIECDNCGIQASAEFTAKQVSSLGVPFLSAFGEGWRMRRSPFAGRTMIHLCPSCPDYTKKEAPK